jgi:hypothetical protein
MVEGWVGGVTWLRPLCRGWDGGVLVYEAQVAVPLVYEARVALGDGRGLGGRCDVVGGDIAVSWVGWRWWNVTEV